MRERLAQRRFTKHIPSIALVLLFAFGIAISLGAQPTPAYVALGDSIEFGLGDDIAADGFGYVPPFGDFLSTVLVQPVTVLNLGVPFARTTDIPPGAPYHARVGRGSASTCGRGTRRSMSGSPVPCAASPAAT